jgi:hypothetical protein
MTAHDFNNCISFREEKVDGHPKIIGTLKLEYGLLSTNDSEYTDPDKFRFVLEHITRHLLKLTHLSQEERLKFCREQGFQTDSRGTF